VSTQLQGYIQIEVGLSKHSFYCCPKSKKMMLIGKQYNIGGDNTSQHVDFKLVLVNHSMGLKYKLSHTVVNPSVNDSVDRNMPFAAWLGEGCLIYLNITPDTYNVSVDTLIHLLIREI
jgi:hypothetical protein